MSRRVEETYLSEALGPPPVSRAADWRSVNTFTPWQRHSRHYVFHGAFAQIENLRIILHMYDVPQQQRIEAAKGLLTAWQGAPGYREAETYLQELRQKFEQSGTAIQ